MEPSVERHLKLGAEALGRNRADLAESQLRKVLARYPDHPYAGTAVAACMRAQRRWDDALAQARWAVARHPTYQYAHFTLASVLAVREAHGEALPHALEAVRLAPNRARYFGLLANIHHETGRFEQSLATTSAGLAVQADHPYVQRIRVVSLAAIGRAGEAEGLLAEVLRAGAGSSAALFCGGWMNWTLGQYEPAVIFLRQALERNPLSADSHAILGLSLFGLGEHPEARAELLESLRLNPFCLKGRRALAEMGMPVGEGVTGVRSASEITSRQAGV